MDKTNDELVTLVEKLGKVLTIWMKTGEVDENWGSLDL